MLTGSGSDVAERAERLGRGALAAVAAGGALVLAGSITPVHLPCPTLALTGVPCPACGLTRLAGAVAHGRVAEAFTVDPAGVVLLALVGAVAAVHLLGRAGIRPAPSIPSRAAVAALVVATALHWLTAMRGGMLPPA
jgi:hypothetical protein